MKRILCIAAGLLVYSSSFTQPTISIIATGLQSPVGIEIDHTGALWIAEGGSGQNDGSVSVIRPDGTVERVIDSLASAFDPMSGETFGPVRAQPVDDNYLAVFTGEAPSDYVSSVLIFPFSAFVQGNPSLRASDAAHVINIGDFVHRNGLPQSDPYTLVHDGCDMYIADAAANAIIRRDGLTGVPDFFATFPDEPNPIPVGPPFYQAVPTRILHNPDGGFVVSQLTGFPFIDSASKIYNVDDEGNVSERHSDLTLVTDMLWSSDGDGLVVLQFARFSLDSVPPFILNSSMILHLHDDGTRDTLLSDFGPSPGMTRDENENYYLTNLFFGTVMKVENLVTGFADPNDHGKGRMMAYPNPANDILNVDFYLETANEVTITLTDMSGRKIYEDKLGMLTAGQQQYQLDVKAWGEQSSGLSHGILTVKAGDTVQSQTVVTRF